MQHAPPHSNHVLHRYVLRIRPRERDRPDSIKLRVATQNLVVLLISLLGLLSTLGMVLVLSLPHSPDHGGGGASGWPAFLSSMSPSSCFNWLLVLRMINGGTVVLRFTHSCGRSTHIHVRLCTNTTTTTTMTVTTTAENSFVHVLYMSHVSVLVSKGDQKVFWGLQMAVRAKPLPGLLVLTLGTHITSTAVVLL